MIDSSDIFGFQLNVGSTSEAIDSLQTLINSKESTGIAFMNSHMIYEALHDPSLYEGLRKFRFVFPDGVPLMRAVNIIQGNSTDRIAGNDMIFSLLLLARLKKWKVTFYGSSPMMLDKIKFKLNNEYDGVSAQLLSPPFRVLDEPEIESYIQQINEFNPDMVFVGLGCPKQENWIASHIDKINAPMFGLGGAFAFFAGVDSRAPLWMRNLSLEWVYRLALEPGRLWKRYLVTNSYFIFLFLREFWRVRIIKKT